MPLETWGAVFRKLNESPMVGRILINGTGDITAVPGWGEYFRVIKGKRKPVIMTTNASGLDHIPGELDGIVVSFNGGTPEGYSKTTGLDFGNVAGNIRALYPEIAKINAEMHCLIWSQTDGEEEAFSEYWKDFPGRRRISYKCENQGREFFGVEKGRDDGRIPCDYLGKICVEWDGRIGLCNHDWEGTTNIGNLLTDSVIDILKNKDRARVLTEHLNGCYTNICEACNYNVAERGKTFYLGGKSDGS